MVVKMVVKKVVKNPHIIYIIDNNKKYAKILYIIIIVRGITNEKTYNTACYLPYDLWM